MFTVYINRYAVYRTRIIAGGGHTMYPSCCLCAPSDLSALILTGENEQNAFCLQNPNHVNMWKCRIRKYFGVSIKVSALA